LRNGDEWSSPAFIKRARTSYGSLFDTGYDPFAEEDGTIPGKGRKRTRLSSVWRYSSRSPSPEQDEESVRTSSEPAAAPLTADEGRQTTGLQAGDAAEVPADSSRQVTDGDMTLRSDEAFTAEDAAHLQHEARSSPSRNDAMSPPAIQASLNSNKASSSQQDQMQETDFSQAPLSPQLKSFSSDALPLVSPLVTPKPGLFTQDGDGIRESAPTIGSFGALHGQEPTPHSGDEHEAVYVGSHGKSEQHPPELQTFQDPETATNEGENSGHGGQFPPENQDGHWMTVNAQLSHSESYKDANETREEQSERLEEEDDGDENEEEQEHLETDGFTSSRSEAPRYQHYPELDDELHGQSANSSWALGSATVAYPDLPEPDDVKRHAFNKIPHPQSSIMSRSQSSQSAVVDLTEDEDEGEGQDAHGDSVDEEANESSVESSLEGEATMQDETARGRYTYNETHMDDEDASLGGEELYDEYYSGDDNYQDRYHEEEYDDEDEDEESYDEEMDVDEAQSRPPAQTAPVVIDLLSSDDEDDGEATTPKPTISTSQPPTPPVQQPEAEDHSSEEDEESEADKSSAEEGMDSTNDVPYAQRSELQTIAPQRFTRESPAEDEEDAPSIVDHDDEGHVEMEDEIDEESERGSDYESEHRGRTEGNEEAEIAPSKASPVDGEFLDQSVAGKSMEAPQISEPEQMEEDELPEDNPKVSEAQEDNDVPDSEIISRTSPHDDDSTVPIEQSPAKHEATQGVENSGGEPTPGEQPSLFSRVFNLDGANDETRTEVSHHVLSNDENTNPPVTASTFELNQDVAIPRGQVLAQDDVQLPTPDDTQPSQLKESQGDSSFSSGLPPSAYSSEGSTTAMHVDPNLENEVRSTLEEQKTVLDKPMESKEIESLETDTITVEMSKNRIDGEVEGPQSKEVADVAVIEAHTPSPPRGEQKELTISGFDNRIEDPEKTIRVSPRRSQRIGKSSGSVPEIAEIMRPCTPDNSHTKGELGSRQTDDWSPVILDNQTTPTGHDASIEMALSALDSPRKQHDDLPRTPATDLKLRLTRALRNDLSEFTALKVLRYNLLKKLDVLAIATTTPAEPQRAKGGPRHYQITFNITDPTIAPSGVTEVQIYRPYKEALPVIDAGDGILLRNFQVIAIKNRGFALRSESNETSSWAVFKNGEDEAQVRGPPVEYGPGEKNHIVSMKEWYGALDSVAVTKLNRANADKGYGVDKGIGKEG
jgi:hypothetical protein